MWWMLGIPSICLVLTCLYVAFLYTQTNCTYDDLFWWVPEWIPLRWLLGEDNYNIKRYRFQTRGWLLQRWDSFYYTYLEPVFQIIGICIFLLFSPILIAFVFLYLFYCAWSALWEFVRTRAMLPIIFSFFGLFFGVMGWQGALIGFVGGFLIGLLIDAVKVSDADYYKPSKPYLHTGFQTKTEPKTVTTTPVYGSYYYERPWIWKGWQIESGPKEDSLRKDL